MNVFSAHNGVKHQPLYLGNHFEPAVQDTAAPFQWYQRLTGETFNCTQIAVDVDVQKNHWRMYRLSREDAETKWIAYESKPDIVKSSPKLPEFLSITRTLLSNGTFTNSDSSNKHMHIPELNLSVSNHWYFHKAYHQRPFLRIFNTTGMSAVDRNNLLNKEWTPSKDTERMVMRTASFGHGQQALDMCIREPDYFGIEAVQGKAAIGFQEQMFVPLAIIQAIRFQTYRSDE